MERMMSKLTYSQLEGVWIRAGGDKNLAPLMAAIALAESGGQTNALNPSDNGGRQSSFGLWQISTGTHTPPSPNWADPVVNAKLAIGKLNSQGLKAWGTYTSGAYKPFLANGVAPTPFSGTSSVSTIPVGESSSTSASTAICAWNIHLPVAGDTCVLTKVQTRNLLGATLLLAGGIVAIAGIAVAVILAFGKDPATVIGGIGNVAQSSGRATL